MDCEICGEAIKLDPAFDPSDRMPALHEEIGEFWDPSKDESVLAHAQCGLSAGMEIA